MKTRVMASLNGISMNDIDSSIVIQKVTEAAPNWNVNAGSRGTLIGQRVTATEKRYREVQVAFAVKIVRELVTREEVLQKVSAWACGGGALTLSYRPGQQLRVMCAALPAVSGIDAWAEQYTVTFRAYEKPFWENDTESEAHATGNNVTMKLEMFGAANADSLMSIKAKNTSGSTCNTLQVTVNGETFKMASLGLANGETFVMDYDERLIQRIRIMSSGGVYRSVLNKRTVDSADDLKVEPTTNTVTATAGTSLAWSVYSFGRWVG